MESQKVAVFLVSLAAMIALCNSECCGSAGLFDGCLGNGPCNIFCCNCDDGCSFNTFKTPRYKNHTKPLKHINAAKIFKEADKNKDGAIDFKEAVSFAANHNISKAALTKNPTWFSKMDKNHDGKITPHELDKSLKNKL